MTKLLFIEQIRAREAAHNTANPKTSLMQRAGEAVAVRAQALLKTHQHKHVLVLAGPGNNGGDAWVAANALRAKKVNVTVLALGEQTHRDAAAQKAFTAYQKASGATSKQWPNDFSGLVIDGLFGIGMSRAPSGRFADIINTCNAAHAIGAVHVLAIDVPSGLNANTGAAFQPCIEADYTLTFIAAKPGLFTADGKESAGDVQIDDLGINQTIQTIQTSQTSQYADNTLYLLSQDAMAALIPRRRANSHKGTFGNVGVIGGAEGMAGAAVLAARAALHMGPGKVLLGLFDKDRPAFDLLHPEIMVRDARTLAKDDSMTAFAVGMGSGDVGAAALLNLLLLNKPMVVDADALNAISSNHSIRAAFEAKKAENARPCLPFIFTPHPGEAARLLGSATAVVQTDRIAAARRIAQTFGVVCILKGAGSIIAHPSGDCAINPTGNPGMASGGTGDALAGMLAALLCMGMNAWDAARLGVYLHGAAADAALHHGMGPHGLTASEIIFEARTLLNSGLDDGHDGHDDHRN